jgi:hypothetical protein
MEGFEDVEWTLFAQVVVQCRDVASTTQRQELLKDIRGLPHSQDEPCPIQEGIKERIFLRGTYHCDEDT